MYRQLKVDISDLKVGMYVAKLDRPWVETPFLFQGFNIKSIEEIETLGKYCKFVIVDEEKSVIKNISTGFLPQHKPVAKITKIQYDRPDILLPTSVEFKRQMRQALSTRHNVQSYVQDAMKSVELGKKPDMVKARALVNQLTENIVTNPTAMVWLTQLKNKDEYTAIHSLNVCVLSLFFGRNLGMPMNQLKELGVGALLHDIGKIKLPLKVLNKPDRLTNEEYGLVKKHTEFGYELLKKNDQIAHESLQVVKSHHERLDGKGYPNQLAGDEINYYTRLVSIVDVYDAITSNRVYHDAMNPYDALNTIFKDAKGTFDRHLVEQFIKYLGVYPIGSVVELNTGQVGIVMSFNEKQHLTPMLLLVLDENKQPYNQYKYLNLANQQYRDNENRLHITGTIDPAGYDLSVSTIIKNESIHLAKM